MELNLFELWGIFLGLALIDTLAPGILGATAYLMLMKSEKKINRLSVFLLITQGSYSWERFCCSSVWCSYI